MISWRLCGLTFGDPLAETQGTRREENAENGAWVSFASLRLGESIVSPGG